MGILDDAKNVAETAGRKLKEGVEDVKDRIGDKVDEVKADAKVSQAEAEKAATEKKNDLKEKLREEE